MFQFFSTTNKHCFGDLGSKINEEQIPINGIERDWGKGENIIITLLGSFVTQFNSIGPNSSWFHFKMKEGGFVFTKIAFVSCYK